MKQWSDKIKTLLQPKIKLRFKAEFIILLYIIMFIAIYPFFQVLTGRVSLEPNSFAADDAGTVYIGQARKILCVYTDGTIREIPIPRFDDGYGLDVEEDALFIGLTNYYSKLDGRRVSLLDGSIEPVKLAVPLTPRNSRYTTDSGDVYRLKNRLFRYRIERQLPDGTWQTVYTMEEREFYMKLALMFSYGIGLPALVLLTLYSAWTQGYSDGKTHGKPWKILIKVTLPPEGGRKDGA